VNCYNAYVRNISTLWNKAQNYSLLNCWAAMKRDPAWIGAAGKND